MQLGNLKEDVFSLHFVVSVLCQEVSLSEILAPAFFIQGAYDHSHDARSILSA